MSESSAVIELANVTKKFGKFVAINETSFQIMPGEIVGFVGANGAGKTTTISMLLGFLNATKGTVKLFGQEVTPQNAHRFHAKTGYASGDMELPLQLTGRQYLRFLMHQSRGNHQETYKQLCERFSPQLDKKIHQLSRGNRQKIALIAALVTDPEVVILDEPTSGLDPVMQEAFLDVVREYKAAGKTVFMSSHYLQEVTDVCSRVLLMRVGEIVEDVKTDDLLTLSGKRITIKTGYRPTKPPKSATSVETVFENEVLKLSFVYKGEMSTLQAWLASVKQLQDVEVSEFNLEEAFSSMYKAEQES